MKAMAVRLRRMRRAVAPIVYVLLAPALLFSACASSSAKTAPKSTPSTTTSTLKFAIIGVEPTTDPIWALVKRGATQAAANTGISITYQAPASGNVSDIPSLINAALSTQPDGLIVAIPDCGLLTPALQQALLIGTPIIAINSGSACSSTLGLLSFIGQDDYAAGLAAGQKLAAAGASNVLCVTPDASDPTLSQRCLGVTAGMQSAHGQVTVYPMDLSNPSAAQQKIQSLLVQNPTIDGVITLSSSCAAVVTAAAQHLIRTSQIVLATFDLSPVVIQAIQQGAMQFAVDQQPYLQGYLAVELLALYKRNINTVLNPLVSTGPDFITSTNVAKIQQLVADGTR